MLLSGVMTENGRMMEENEIHHNERNEALALWQQRDISRYNWDSRGDRNHSPCSNFKAKFGVDFSEKQCFLRHMHGTMTRGVIRNFLGRHKLP